MEQAVAVVMVGVEVGEGLVAGVRAGVVEEGLSRADVK